MTEPTGSEADETSATPTDELDGAPPDDADAAVQPEAEVAAEAADDAEAGGEADDGLDERDDETDDDGTDDDEAEGDEADDDELEDLPSPSRRLRQVGALLAVIAGFLFGAGLFLPYAASAGVDNPGLAIDFSQPSWVIGMSNLGIPALMVLTGLAVLGEFMRPSVGAGVVLTASISRLLTSAAGLAFLLMVGPEAQLALSSGFYVLGGGGLLGLLAGAILLASSRRSPG